MSNNFNGLSIKKRSPPSACANRGLLSSASEAEEVADLLPERELGDPRRGRRNHQLRPVGHHHSVVPQDANALPLLLIPAGLLVHLNVRRETVVNRRPANRASRHVSSPFWVWGLGFESWIARLSCANCLAKARPSDRFRSPGKKPAKRCQLLSSLETASRFLLGLVF